jgi:hypothetical protein
MKLLLPLIFALMSGGPTAWAWPYEDGVAANKRGDYAVAPQLIQPLAEAGDEDGAKERDRVAKGMTRSQLEQSRKLALDCQKQKFKACR